MNDMEKTVKKLSTDELIEELDYCGYDPYYDSLRKPIISEIRRRLKGQEAVTIKKTKEHGFGVYGGICPKCNNWIQSAHSFCGFCGQAVKWE